jgi:hypothetical protein
MSTMIAELYEALISAGAPEEKAKAASTEIGDYEGRFAKIKADLLVVKWMCGVLVAGMISVMAGTITLVIKSFV